MRTTTTIARACRACLTGLAGSALVILSASLAQAVYGPRTTIGNNYQQTSGTMSEDGINEGECDGFSCYVLFQRVPQDKDLIIQHISCVMLAEGPLSHGALGIRTGQSFEIKSNYVLPVHTAGDIWVVNSPVMHLVKSGQRAQIVFQSSQATTWSMGCNISGKLQQP